jgi:hypothetical protein
MLILSAGRPNSRVGCARDAGGNNGLDEVSARKVWIHSLGLPLVHQ